MATVPAPVQKPVITHARMLRTRILSHSRQRHRSPQPVTATVITAQTTVMSHAVRCTRHTNAGDACKLISYTLGPA
jgi:hypothetical protein